jgi:hypothetical protein
VTLYPFRHYREISIRANLKRLWWLRGLLQNLMIIWTLQGTTPRDRSMSWLPARVVAMLALALMLNCASAQGLMPTRQKPVKARHNELVASVPAKRGSRNIPARASKASQKVAKTALRESRSQSKASSRFVSEKPTSKRFGTKRHGTRASDRAPQKPEPRGKTRERRQRNEDLQDEPTMYRTRMMKPERGRRGRRASVLLVGGHAREYTRSVVVIGPAPLRGTHEILVHQNLMADEAGLERIQDDSDLDRLRTNRDLVDFVNARDLYVNPELPENRRCARVWTVQFVNDLAREFYAKFGQPLDLNSAARSVTYQLRLQTTNGNAAGTDGDSASPHLTGQAIDIGKRAMSRAQLAWMRERLVPLIQSGKIDVEEEFKQACFHISVYRSYIPTVQRQSIAQLRPSPMQPAEPGPMVTAPELK